MSSSHHSQPSNTPISTVLFLGLILDKLPVRLVQPVLDGLLRIVLSRHPGCLDRMADWSRARVLIDPVDLPFAILLRPNSAHPSLQAYNKEEVVDADAIIRGPLATLIELVEGRVDGDTLFFSRELIVQGDTEVVLALRNTVDDAGINILEDIAVALGPLGHPFRAAASVGSKIASRLQRDLTTLGVAVIAPAVRQSDAQSIRITQLEEEIKVLRRQRPRSARQVETSNETP